MFAICSLLVQFILIVKSVPPDACFAHFRDDDCGGKPTAVMYYYKPGSRCEVGIWRGCLPNLNMFTNEYDCVRTCIFKPRVSPELYHMQENEINIFEDDRLNNEDAMTPISDNDKAEIETKDNNGKNKMNDANNEKKETDYKEMTKNITLGLKNETSSDQNTSKDSALYENAVKALLEAKTLTDDIKEFVDAVNTKLASGSFENEIQFKLKIDEVTTMGQMTLEAAKTSFDSLKNIFQKLKTDPGENQKVKEIGVDKFATFPEDVYSKATAILDTIKTLTFTNFTTDKAILDDMLKEINDPISKALSLVNEFTNKKIADIWLAEIKTVAGKTPISTDKLTVDVNSTIDMISSLKPDFNESQKTDVVNAVYKLLKSAKVALRDVTMIENLILAAESKDNNAKQILKLVKPAKTSAKAAYSSVEDLLTKALSLDNSTIEELQKVSKELETLVDTASGDAKNLKDSIEKHWPVTLNGNKPIPKLSGSYENAVKALLEAKTLTDGIKEFVDAVNTKLANGSIENEIQFKLKIDEVTTMGQMTLEAAKTSFDSLKNIFQKLKTDPGENQKVKEIGVDKFATFPEDVYSKATAILDTIKTLTFTNFTTDKAILDDMLKEINDPISKALSLVNEFTNKKIADIWLAEIKTVAGKTPISTDKLTVDVNSTIDMIRSLKPDFNESQKADVVNAVNKLLKSAKVALRDVTMIENLILAAESKDNNTKQIRILVKAAKTSAKAAYSSVEDLLTKALSLDKSTIEELQKVPKELETLVVTASGDAKNLKQKLEDWSKL